MAEKDDPTRIRAFEVYTDPEAYRLHLETPHFRKFRDTTDRMVTSRKLLDGVPIALAAKSRQRAAFATDHRAIQAQLTPHCMPL